MNALHSVLYSAPSYIQTQNSENVKELESLHSLHTVVPLCCAFIFLNRGGIR